jgi:hypothetical protein
MGSKPLLWCPVTPRPWGWATLSRKPRPQEWGPQSILSWPVLAVSIALAAVKWGTCPHVYISVFDWLKWGYVWKCPCGHHEVIY